MQRKKSTGEIDRRTIRKALTPPLTTDERTRLYCLFKACPHCGRKPGEYCLSNRGSLMLKDTHWQRGPWAQDRRAMRDPVQRERYEKLKAKIVAARRPAGDATEEYF